MAVWSELQTDMAWDPWVLAPLFATLAGHENGEAVAINATTINDPDVVAATWRNQGGGGAGQWQAADETEIAAALDDGFRFGKPITGTDASFSGLVSVGSLEAEGDVHAGGNVAADGDVAAGGEVSGETGAFSGAVHVGSLLSDGDISGVAGHFSGDIDAVGGSFSGAVTIDGALVANDAVTLGSAAADALIVKSTSTFAAPAQFQGAATFDGAVTLGNAAGDVISILGTASVANPISGSLSATGGLSAGASSSFTGGVSIISGGLTVIAGGVDAGAAPAPPLANIGYREGFAKGWAYFDPTAVGSATRFNVAGITDTGPGNWTITWHRAFASTSYAVVALASGSWDGSPGQQRLCQEFSGGRATTATQIVCTRPDTAALTDPTRVNVVAFGTQ